MKKTTTWYSQRLGRDVGMARWGETGQPVIVFATAGGDAEEIERFHLVSAVGHLLEAGRIKLYSCDNIGGRVLLTQEGSPQHRGMMQSQFLEYIVNELVPAVRADCNSEDVEIIAAGSSIGAFTALASICRYPWVFSRALCMSGTYDLTRFIKDGDPGPAFYGASPVHYLPHVTDKHLQMLRQRLIVLASGEGRAEDINESWRVARVLGSLGVPNRVDSWGKEWHHDWVTWRAMLPKYLEEWTATPE